MEIKKSYIIYLLFFLVNFVFSSSQTSLRPSRGEGEVFEKTKTTKAPQNRLYHTRCDF